MQETQMSSTATDQSATDAATQWRAGHISDPVRLAPRLGGAGYQRLLAATHRDLKPRTYFEIGTRLGDSLKWATCPSVAVDPMFRLPDGFVESRPQLQLFSMTSDQFFRSNNLTECLGRPVDLAFLDGLHRFEFLLRDFINTERYCHAQSAIMLHDCVPTTSEIVHREQNGPRDAAFDVMPRAWAGDVWKLIPILRRYRPDLKITAFDATPTGLVFVTRLDPGSTILRDRYDDIVVEFMEADIAAIGVSAFVAGMALKSTDAALAAGRLPAMIA